MRGTIRGRPTRPDKDTMPVASAGGVVIDASGRVLLLRTADEGIWCFPKGHIERGETAEDAARREIAEECGLAVEIGDRIAEVAYSFYWPPEDVNYDKRVVYFLAHPRDGDVRLEDRFDAWRWATPARARRMLHYGNDRHVLAKAVVAARLRRGT
ncbi:MAG TPA: NUDIX domain-containing protein [Thermoplasmata archaeon]|nr:NUDIX domain-containing protein [Thermoplasmata archaeon]